MEVNAAVWEQMSDLMLSFTSDIGVPWIVDIDVIPKNQAAFLQNSPSWIKV
jgi:hypothetical protein